MTHGRPGAGAPEEQLRQLVRDLTGLDLTARRGPSFAAALARAARAAGDPDDASHARALLAGRLPLRPFVEELTVGETWFFRDAAQWSFIEGTVIPEARARRRGQPGHRFRAWSAGCATGEEPYSLAIALHEAGIRERVHLVGTDVNETALDRARAARFSLWSLRGDRGGRTRRHLREEGGRLALAPEIARTVRFFPLNLAGDAYPSPSLGLADLDLVLCRNVLLYLEPSVGAEVARRLHGCLAPGGWLLTGAADPVLSSHASFEVSAGPHGVAYRRPASRALPSAAPRSARRELPRALPRALRAAPRASPPRPSPAPPASPAPRRAPAPGAAPPARDARALLDSGRPADALALIDAGLARRPLDAAAHFERAVALVELGRPGDAEDACRRALYLARRQPFVHFFAGMLRLRRGDRAGARRAFGAAAALLERRDPDEEVPLSHGMTAGVLADAVRAQLSGASGRGGAGR